MRIPIVFEWQFLRRLKKVAKNLEWVMCGVALRAYKSPGGYYCCPLEVVFNVGNAFLAQGIRIPLRNKIMAAAGFGGANFDPKLRTKILKAVGLEKSL